MVIDCHVHTCAFASTPGLTSAHPLSPSPLRPTRGPLGLPAAGPEGERALENKIFSILDDPPDLDAAVLLAFDAVHDASGNLDRARTPLYVTNDYAADLARRH